MTMQDLKAAFSKELQTLQITRAERKMELTNLTFQLVNSGS